MMSVGVMIYLVLPKELKRCHTRQKCIFSVELKTFFTVNLKPGLHCDISTSINTSINISSVNRERHKHEYKHDKKESFPFTCAYVAKISV